MVRPYGRIIGSFLDLSQHYKEYKYEGFAAAAKMFSYNGIDIGKSILMAYTIANSDTSGRNEDGESVSNLSSVKIMKLISGFGLTDEQNVAAVAHYCSSKAANRLASAIAEYNKTAQQKISLADAAEEFLYITNDNQITKRNAGSYLSQLYPVALADVYYYAAHGN